MPFLARIELNAAEKTSRMTPPFGPALATALFGDMRARDFIHYGMRSYHLQGMANQLFLGGEPRARCQDRRVLTSAARNRSVPSIMSIRGFTAEDGLLAGALAGEIGGQPGSGSVGHRHGGGEQLASR
jgi:hypothetical protein